MKKLSDCKTIKEIVLNIPEKVCYNISFWLISKAKSKREKIFYIITILIDIMYAYVIWQARSALLYKTIIVVMMIFLQQTNVK